MVSNVSYVNAGSSASPSGSPVGAHSGRNEVPYWQRHRNSQTLKISQQNVGQGRMSPPSAQSTGFRPTQPMTRRSKAPPIASGQPVQVKSPHPNVSGGTASYMTAAQNSHFRRVPTLRTIDVLTNTWSQKCCTNSRIKAFFQSSHSLALTRGMAANPQKEGKSEQPEGWY